MDTQTLTRITLVLAITAALGGWFALEWARKQRPSAKLKTGGMQEVTVLVRNGYHPDTIRLWAGRPVRLVFQRAEDNSCSSRVYLAEPPISRYLPPFTATAIVFTPTLVGTHLFTCEEGRHRGHLIVERPAPWQRRGMEVAGARNGVVRKPPECALSPRASSLMDLANRTSNSHERFE